MEELEMTRALRRYVEAGEPPFPLTAEALIAQARQRHRWRLGLGIGGGGAATALAIFSAFALTPAGGGDSVLGPNGCDVPLPLGILSAVPEPSPSGQAPAPGPIKPSPSADPSQPPQPQPSGGALGPTTFPSQPQASDVPSPSTLPQQPQPSGRAPGPSTLPQQPQASDVPSPSTLPQQLLPSGGAPNPTSVPPLPGGGEANSMVLASVEQKRIDEMECFLRGRIRELKPKAKFALYRGAPMEVNWNNGTFEAGAYVIDGPRQRLITVSVSHSDASDTPEISHYDRSESIIIRTGKSRIVIFVEGSVISENDAMAIAKAPELDVYR